MPLLNGSIGLECMFIGIALIRAGRDSIVLKQIWYWTGQKV